MLSAGWVCSCLLSVRLPPATAILWLLDYMCLSMGGTGDEKYRKPVPLRTCMRLTIYSACCCIAF